MRKNDCWDESCFFYIFCFHLGKSNNVVMIIVSSKSNRRQLMCLIFFLPWKKLGKGPSSANAYDRARPMRLLNH